ncbi:hypothetical protein GSI_05853 [Ganoderma sinense ZZ0214-1]|uniref:HNH nuclease domain-containing protein n=1 Tax=Ganoderma sinense ZZ0214-1 TaxID=1077348 RepID=A0A2G8SBL1_9APHY|nr:hypothetical protein GSI_05853 [Ganoderma sinense ZZ0214-1]
MNIREPLPARPEPQEISRRPRPLDVKHPRLNFPLFRFPAFSTGSPTTPYGVSRLLILDACRVITNHAANCQGDFLSTDKQGQDRLEIDDTPLDVHCYYFLGAPEVEANRDYPIVKTFSAFRFPSVLPAHWARIAERRPPLLYNHGFSFEPCPMSDLVWCRDRGVCTITRWPDATQCAHLIPKAEEVWFVTMDMSAYLSDQCIQGGTGIDDPGNGMLLRADVHEGLNEPAFVLYPAHSTGEDTTFVAYFVGGGYEHLPDVFHRRPVAIPQDVPVEFLYARFAHSIINLPRDDIGFRAVPELEEVGDLARCSPTLPGDVILQLCKELFDSAPGPDQYDLSLARVTPNQWCAEQRFRKGLALVSKLWWEPATRALYEHVVIRQVDQIAALARTLRTRAEDAGVDFGALVKRITFHECVAILAREEYNNIVGEDVQTIFERCVALEELSLRRHHDSHCEDAGAIVEECVYPSNRFSSKDRINPVWIFPQIIVPTLQARGHTTLRKLDLVTFAYHRNPNLAVALYNLIAASPHITTLAVRSFAAPGPDLPSLQFLEELTLNLSGSYFHAPPDPLEVWQWTLPRLRSLTLLESFHIPIPVLDALGRTLSYLHIHNAAYCADRNLAGLPALCPALEHLVLHPQESLPDWRPALFRESASTSTTGHFPRLRFLDVWITSEPDAHGQMWDAARAAALLAHARARIAPALEGVRALLVCSPDPPYTLPTVCHPSTFATLTSAGADRDESRLVCVRDVWMLQTAWCVRRAADLWLDEDMWLEDDSGDYVYESPSDDSAKGSGWDSAEELSDDSVGSGP